MGMSLTALPAGAGNSSQPLTETLERNLDQLRESLPELRNRDRQALSDWADTLAFCRDKLYSRNLGKLEVRDMLREFDTMTRLGFSGKEEKEEVEALASRMRAEVETWGEE